MCLISNEKTNKIFNCEHVNNDIVLCFVNIPEFVEKFLPEIDINSNILKRVKFDKNILLKIIFTPDEIKYLNKFKTLKKQIEWMSGRFAIKTLVLINEGTNFSPVEYSDVEISALENGAPYLKDYPDFNIAISHSNKIAAGGICLNRNTMFGIDIEKIETNDMEPVIAVAFSEREKKYLNKNSHEKIYRNFTIKEAFLKYIKEGFNESLKKIEIINDNLYWCNELVTNLRVVSKIYKKKYALTVLYNS